MVARNDERKLSNASNHHKHVDSVGYVPRDRQESIKDTGLTSAGMLNDNPEAEHEVN